MKKILFIQPHSDDIILSCFAKLVDEDIEPTILTIEFDEKRHKEDEKLIEFIPNLKIINGIEFGTPDTSYKDYWGKNMHRKFISEEVMTTILDSLGDEKVEEILILLSEAIDSEEWDEIYTCMGVGHPLHWLIHELTKDTATHFYRDWPHSYKKRNKAFFDEYASTFKFSEEVKDEETLELKHDLFKRFYKTQSGLLYFEQKNIENNFSEKYYTS